MGATLAGSRETVGYPDMTVAYGGEGLYALHELRTGARPFANDIWDRKVVCKALSVVLGGGVCFQRLPCSQPFHVLRLFTSPLELTFTAIFSALQFAMLSAPWPALLLADERCAPTYASEDNCSRSGQLLFRGLRIRVGLSTGW